MKGSLTGSLRQIGAISSLALRRVAHDRGLVWLVAMPLVLIYVLGVTMHGLFSMEFTPAKPYKVVVAIAQAPGAASPSAPGGLPVDGADRAGRIAERLSRAPESFSVELARAENDARRAVLERKADAAVLIRLDGAEPTGAGLAGPAYTIVAPPESIVAGMLAEALREFERESPAGAVIEGPAPGDSGPKGAGTLEAAVGRASEWDGSAGQAGSGLAVDAPWARAGAFQYFSVALTVMFMTFACHSAMAYAAEDRISGVYLRVRSLGISRATYLAAGVASSALIGVVFALVMALVTRVLFRVLWGDPVAWSLMTLCGAASIAAISFLVMALLPNHPKSVGNAGATIYTILSFLGGSTVPLAIMPRWFAEGFAWLPNRKMLEGYLVIAQGASATSLGRELLGLASTAVGLLALSLLVMRILTKEEA